MAIGANPRPFVKWAGGKNQLTVELLKRLPAEFYVSKAKRNYHEPFVGGGAFFFALYRENWFKRLFRRAYLSDLNAELISTYISIRDDVVALIKELDSYPHDKGFFYDLRAADPEQMAQVERAARFIYLNKTCYNGLYRVNSQGRFNVPFGTYKSPKICDKENLKSVSKALKKVVIECTSFETVLKRSRKGDLVYFDPPYEPISKTANFTSYQANGFNQDAQRRLHDVFHKLTGREVRCILSNSSADLIKDLYNDNGFHTHKVKAIRAINSNPSKRGKLTELIVTNYATGYQSE